MKYCKFCNEQIKLTEDNCTACGSYTTGTKGESRLEEIDEILSNNGEEYQSVFNESDLDLRDWSMPPYLEFGRLAGFSLKNKKNKLALAIYLIVCLFLIITAYSRATYPPIIYLALALCLIVIQPRYVYVEALKLENSLKESRHTIRYNKNNKNGGSGLETFIIDKDDFSKISLKIVEDTLVEISFDQYTCDVSQYENNDFLMRFMKLYALKFDKSLDVRF